MILRIIAISAILALAAAAPAGAGFWGDLKRSFGTAVDNAQHDGAHAAEAVGEAAGDAADAVVEGTGSAVDYVTGDSAAAPEGAEVLAAQPPDDMAEPVSGAPKPILKQLNK